MQSLLRSSLEPPAVPRPQRALKDAGGPGTGHRDLLGPVTDDVAVGVRHVRNYDAVPPWPSEGHVTCSSPILPGALVTEDITAT